jgi:hypothetical protein
MIARISGSSLPDTRRKASITGLPVVRPRPADQRSVNVEQHQRGSRIFP